MTNHIPIFLLTVICLSLSAFGGCGGKLAKTGCAAVTDVACGGAMRMQYADGNSTWKRINPDDIPKSSKIAEKHRLKSARYVETRNGGTLTFPNGETILYRDLY